jgi:transcriptional regulator with XRE-family HTH domain
MAKRTTGEKLRDWRLASDLTQQAAAKKARISQSAWCDYENDKKTPRVKQASRIQKITSGEVQVTDW